MPDIMINEETTPEPKAPTTNTQWDDDLDEPLPVQQCRIDDPDCESCQ